MIPFSVFLLAWVILLGIHFIFSLITILQMTRFGIAGFGTYASTVLFVTVVLVTLIACGAYFFTIDWSQPITIFDGLLTSPFLNP